jgi:D-alanine--D-alanine ligase
MKKVGIFFGGSSREREISFFGGRTIFDNLDRNLYEPVLIFIDNFRNFILIDWKLIYKGSILDFYSFSLNNSVDKNLYMDSCIEKKFLDKKILEIGKIIYPEDFKKYFDFVFLTLHGNFGEDGSIQGILDWYQIPYSGSKILGSAIGLDKVFQKKILEEVYLYKNRFFTIKKNEWLKSENKILKILYQKVKNKKIVIKSSTQGSSIGISVLENFSFSELKESIDKSFFIKNIEKYSWINKSLEEKIIFCKKIFDIKNELGYPLYIYKKKIYTPSELLKSLDENFLAKDSLKIISENCENEVLIEEFVDGIEFSSIVLQEKNKKPVCLPPTGLIKKNSFVSYTDKYLYGQILKKTPIKLDLYMLEKLSKLVEKIFLELSFSTYARIDGIIQEKKIYINDPNTTVGMLPSSFLFQQASQIGMAPRDLITFIIKNS